MTPPLFGRTVRTARLVLSPVQWRDIDDVAGLKADAGAFGLMLGGVRSRPQAEAEMADELGYWARRGIGIFTVRETAREVGPHRDGREEGRFVGITGLHDRPDGRGVALRFAIFPWARGRGIAREAAAAALRFAHDNGVERVVGVARESNFGSRTVLGGIGMTVVERFERDGEPVLVYESVRT